MHPNKYIFSSFFSYLLIRNTDDSDEYLEGVFIEK